MKSRREHRHSSIIYLHGNPVGFGHNTEDYHAEEEAINDAGGFNVYERDFSKHTIVNIRITPGGRIGIAKPCLSCMELLRQKNFRKVIYSTNKGTFEEIYL